MRHASLAVGAASVALVGYLAACGGDDTNEGSSEGQGAAGPTSTTGNPGAAGPGGAGGSTGGAGGSTPSLVNCEPASGAMPTLKLTEIASGLNDTLLVKSAPDDPDRLYIVQRSGEILIYEGNAVLPTPFLDVSGEIVAGGEQGLLGLAFHPGYAQNGRFFVHYSANGGGESTVMEYKRSAGDPHVAEPTSVQLVLHHDTAQGNHNGGTTEFGEDGFLYIGLGDGGNQGDPECDAQQKGTNLLGKISRIDVEGTPDADGYPAAAGNPDGAKYYHVGFRNPWRMAFDPCTADLYIGDVGQDTYEEVSVVAKADGPKNFGWPFREAAHDFGGGSCPMTTDTFIEPLAEYSHGQGCSVTGGYVYRGSAIPALRGMYFYGDFCGGAVWVVSKDMPNMEVMVPELSDLGDSTVSSFGQDGRGEVYVVDLHGSVYRIDPG